MAKYQVSNSSPNIKTFILRPSLAPLLEALSKDVACAAAVASRDVSGSIISDLYATAVLDVKNYCSTDLAESIKAFVHVKKTPQQVYLEAWRVRADEIIMQFSPSELLYSAFSFNKLGIKPMQCFTNCWKSLLESKSVKKIKEAINEVTSFYPNMLDSFVLLHLIRGKEANNSILHASILNECDAELVDFILSKGANVNNPNSGVSTFLHIAACYGYIEIMEVLLEHKDIAVNAQLRKSGITPLHGAACRGRVEAVKLLLAHKNIDVNKQTLEGKTPFDLAAERKHVEMLYLILAHKLVNDDISEDFNVNEPIVNGITPLDLAATYMDSEMTRLLIARGADVNSVSPPFVGLPDHKTPLKLITDKLESNPELETKAKDCIRELLSSPQGLVIGDNKELVLVLKVLKESTALVPKSMPLLSTEFYQEGTREQTIANNAIEEQVQANKNNIDSAKANLEIHFKDCPNLEVKVFDILLEFYGHGTVHATSEASPVELSGAAVSASAAASAAEE